MDGYWCVSVPDLVLVWVRVTVGFFKIHREMMDPDSWVSSLSYHDRWLAVVCIGKANFKPGKWFDGKTMIDVPRGSFITTVDKLRITLGCDSTTKKIRRGLAKLRAANFISFGQSRGQRYTLLTVCNYSRYQDREPEKDNEMGIKGATKGASKGQYEGNKGATIEEGKKGRREELSLFEKEIKSRFDFEAVYRNYPKKTGKSKGLAKLSATVKTPEDFAQLAKAVEWMSRAWRGHDNHFCPGFLPFANGRMWADDEWPKPSAPNQQNHNPASNRGKRLA